MTYTDQELDTIVTVRQIRQAGACVEGQVGWYRDRGISWRHVVKNGISIRDILAQDDGDGNQVVERIVAKMREDSGG